MGLTERVTALRHAELPDEARSRIIGGIALVVLALPIVVLATWVWPPAFRADRIGRDVVLAVGGGLVALAAAASAAIGVRRAVQGRAMARPPVLVAVTGHRRFSIRRRPGTSGHEDARHYLRLDVAGRRPVGVRVDEDLARRFRHATDAELWRLGPVVSLRVDDEVVHLRRPAGPFPRETEAL